MIMDETCVRCRGDLRYGWVTSTFSTERICLDCKLEEVELPTYLQAHRAEEDAVRRGELNYPGLGLTDADRAKIAELIKRRRQP